MAIESKINYSKRPVPSSPSPQQITVVGQESMKGTAPFVSKLPKDYVVPGPKESNEKRKGSC